MARPTSRRRSTTGWWAPSCLPIGTSRSLEAVVGVGDVDVLAEPHVVTDLDRLVGHDPAAHADQAAVADDQGPLGHVGLVRARSRRPGSTQLAIERALADVDVAARRRASRWGSRAGCRRRRRRSARPGSCPGRWPRRAAAWSTPGGSPRSPCDDGTAAPGVSAIGASVPMPACDPWFSRRRRVRVVRVVVRPGRRAWPAPRAATAATASSRHSSARPVTRAA